MRQECGGGPGIMTDDLIDLIRGRPVDGADLHRTALFALDAVASIVGGQSTGAGRILLDWARETGVPGVDAGRAAFLMGSLCHILEIDDLHRASVVHPGCVVVPAVLALADRAGTRPDGRQCLTAILHGFEAACRIGAGVGRAHYRIWHNTATCGPFGSAMATATLLGLSREETVHALGNAGTQSAGLWQFLDTGAMSKHLHAGRGAEAGFVAAGLARHGFTGAPRILEGERGFFRAMCPDGEIGRILADPEAPWQLGQTSIKPWPSCRHTHPVVDAASEIRRRLSDDGLDANSVDRVDILTYRAALDLCDRPDPATEYDAKFSLQHSAAAALADDAVWFESFYGTARDRLAALRARVSVVADESFNAAYPAHWGCELRIAAGGRAYKASRSAALGDPELPLSDNAMIAKARRLLELGGAEAPDRIISAIMAMADGGPPPPVADLVRLGTPAYVPEPAGAG
jgi:2-methylcitrate dehydratase PrpD